jgi:hypothetical protein
MVYAELLKGWHDPKMDNRASSRDDEEKGRRFQ